MSLILGLDTATENAALFLVQDDTILVSKTNSRQSDHASWLHVAVEEALRESNKKISDLSAVAVTSGPGSYTGLRVGLAAAKGFCYALKIPLITESTLHLIASGVTKTAQAGVWISPMIDARRMEVFTTLYDDHLEQQMEPAAMILDEDSFKAFLDGREILFCGNGSPKWQAICRHPNAGFTADSYRIEDFAAIATRKLSFEDFTDLAWSEPAYIKNVYTAPRRS